MLPFGQFTRGGCCRHRCRLRAVSGMVTGIGALGISSHVFYRFENTGDIGLLAHCWAAQREVAGGAVAEADRWAGSEVSWRAGWMFCRA